MILSDPMKENVMMLRDSVERSEAVRAEQVVVPAWMEQALNASEWVRVERKSALGMSWVVAVEPVVQS